MTTGIKIHVFLTRLHINKKIKKKKESVLFVVLFLSELIRYAI